MKREWIDLHFKKGISVRSIADTYGYPRSTVYRWIGKMDPHKKERSDKGKARRVLELPDLNKLSLDGESPETQIEIMIDALMSAISKQIKPMQAVTYVKQLTMALKQLRSMQFASMAKDIDAKVVESIIRRYEPNATSLRVIEVFKEELARVKARETAS